MYLFGLVFLMPSLVLPPVYVPAPVAATSAVAFSVLPRTLEAWAFVDVSPLEFGWYNLTITTQTRLADQLIVSPVIRAINNIQLRCMANLYGVSNFPVYINGSLRLSLSNAFGNVWRPTRATLTAAATPDDLNTYYRQTNESVVDCNDVGGLLGDTERTFVDMCDNACVLYDVGTNTTTYHMLTDVVQRLVVFGLRADVAAYGLNITVDGVRVDTPRLATCTSPSVTMFIADIEAANIEVDENTIVAIVAAPEWLPATIMLLQTTTLDGIDGACTI